MEVLLLEPPYKNKYPPLGLMKISTFHKERGDKVAFFKGDPKSYEKRFQSKKCWDRIYIPAVFTYHYNQTLQTIRFAKKLTSPDNIYIGGVGATIPKLKSLYEKEGINVVTGLLTSEGKIGLEGDSSIDTLIPDYSILDEIDYKYPVNDSYIGYATRGCVNHCPFCAVPLIEPEFIHYYDLKKYVSKIEEKYGEKKDLLLLDNNVLASNKFSQIIEDIIDLGFERDAKDGKGRNRFVDFNQGLDQRLLTKEKAKLLAKIALKPARVAFDHIELTALYKKTITLLAEEGFKYLSNYLLYNYQDKPADLYHRIMINIDLNEELDTRIYSYPMKYIPLDRTDRSFVGNYWTKKQLRAIQCILMATHGLVGPKRKFVQRAFGESLEEFETLLWMPENYIIYRDKNEKHGAKEWRDEFEKLSDDEKKVLIEIIKDDSIKIPLVKTKATNRVKKILNHYTILWKRRKTIITMIDDFV